MSDYTVFRKIVEQAEERLATPLSVHLSNGLVGHRSFFRCEPLHIEVLISMEECRTGREAIDALLRCVARIEHGEKEHTEPADTDIDVDTLNRAGQLRNEFRL